MQLKTSYTLILLLSPILIYIQAVWYLPLPNAVTGEHTDFYEPPGKARLKVHIALNVFYPRMLFFLV